MSRMPRKSAGSRLARSFIILAVAVLLSVLAPAPAQAQIDIVKFQGWIWNLTDREIAVQRVTAQCWDPQQLAYQKIQPNTFWSVVTASQDDPFCQSAFISANVLDENNNVLFWFELTDRFIDNVCSISLYQRTSPFYSRTRNDCGQNDTLSYTMYVMDPPQSSQFFWGLNPNPNP